ncbi:hypothetical protein EON68_00190 [archaeon]|nr:MAG: hypothetical protein EON68_00190 [archaeon]
MSASQLPPVRRSSYASAGPRPGAGSFDAGMGGGGGTPSGASTAMMTSPGGNTSASALTSRAAGGGVVLKLDDVLLRPSGNGGATLMEVAKPLPAVTKRRFHTLNDPWREPVVRDPRAESVFDRLHRMPLSGTLAEAARTAPTTAVLGTNAGKPARPSTSAGRGVSARGSHDDAATLNTTGSARLLGGGSSSADRLRAPSASSHARGGV